ncbi:MAG TPA: nuclear transport factor 2 family protein [Verrucomicrobiae bacterium]|nr:nuclear transport factor 2 family protein [Verrucomicrobiae bacterium]
MKAVLVFAIALLWSVNAKAAGETPSSVAEAFATALSAADQDAVKRYLSPDVLIYETGGQEASRAEYASHHLGADMAFIAKLKRSTLSRQEGVGGDLAWVATRTRLTGTYKDKPVDLYSTESLVLKRGPDGWRIIHVHWSSAPVEPLKSP